MLIIIKTPFINLLNIEKLCASNAGISNNLTTGSIVEKSVLIFEQSTCNDNETY